MLPKIGILCAGDDELAPFLLLLDRRSVRRQAMLTIHEDGSPAFLPPLCTVVSARSMRPSLPRSSLTAAGWKPSSMRAQQEHRPSISIFDTVISTETAYHDVAEDILTEFHPWMDSIWFPGDPFLLSLATQAAQDSGRPVRFGRMVTGEAFLSGPGTEAVRSAFHPLCADMESAAVAHVCHANGIPFLSIRTITDSADRSAAACFEENCRRASEIAAQVTHALLKRLAVSESCPIEKGELP